MGRAGEAGAMTPGTTSCWGWKQEVFRIHSKCMRDPESFEQAGDMVYVFFLNSDNIHNVISTGPGTE